MKTSFKVFLLLFFALPVTTSAAGLDYASIYKLTGDKLVIQSGALENKNYYLCQTSNLVCQNLGSQTPDLKSLDLIPAESTEQNSLLIDLKNTYKEIRNSSRQQFSPTNRYFVYYISTKVNNDQYRHHVIVDLKNPTSPKRTEIKGQAKNWDLLTEENRLFSFSPDESFFIYADDRGGYPTLYKADLPQAGKTLVSKKLFARNYSVGDFLIWDKNTLYFYANRESATTWTLYRYRLDNGELKKIADNISYGEKIYRSGDYLLFTQLTKNRKTVNRYDPTDGTIQTFKTLSIASPFPNLVRKETTLAGREATIVRTNKNPGKPLIIWLHGGPYRQIAPASTYHSYQSYAVYDWLLDQMAEGGAIVAKVDYVGSYGYGRKFADSIVGQVGKKDVTDILAVTAELKTLYKPSAIYLVGNSYGGYLALRTLAEKPSNYAGIASINGVTDWTKLLEYYQNSIFNTYFEGLRADDNDPLFLQANIVTKLDRVTTQKILLVQNSADKTIPPIQAKWLAGILTTRHKPFDYVTYEGEDHVFAQSKNLTDLCQKIGSLIKIKASCQW
ncbi:MAG: prolyl oligopeptidase family serine peptidase [Candidatus Paceibacterota bacterium]|jgi:dipeptidyl aminopeptidase/acylaminoacyl peptidase